MKCLPSYSLAILTLITWPGRADEVAQLLVAVRTYEADRGFDAAKKLEAAVARAGNGSADDRRAMEGRLAAALEEAETREAKSLLCRLLQRFAGEQSVPALSKLLPDEEVGHMVRFALATIPGDEASAAMREALGKVSEKHQIGLINALAQRGDHEALPLFVERLKSPALSSAAIQGLGLLGSREAVAALGRHRAGATSPLMEIEDALLTAADALLEAGDRSEARQIYLRLTSSRAAHQRIAGLRGLAAINDLLARAQVEKALTDRDTGVQRSALRFMVSMAGEGALPMVLEILPGMTPTLQEWLINWLGEHGDASARQRLAPFLESGEISLQRAAVRALGSVGNSETVPRLLACLSHEDAEVRRTARASLIQLSGDEIDAAMASALDSHPDRQLDLIGLLAARGARGAYPALLRVGREGAGEVRRAAIKALGGLATTEELPSLIALLSDPVMKGESKAVETAVLGAFRQISDPDERAQPLLRAYAGATDAVRPSLINLLGRAGSEKALIRVRHALESDHAATRNAAVHALARWPSADPIDDLYQLAQSSVEKSHRVVALRGYVNMARGLKDAPARFEKALALAKSPEDRKLVLSGLGHTNSLGALKLCQGLLGDGEVGTEAALACIQISRRAWRSATDEVEKLMESLAEHEDETVRRGAKRVLERIVK